MSQIDLLRCYHRRAMFCYCVFATFLSCQSFCDRLWSQAESRQVKSLSHKGSDPLEATQELSTYRVLAGEGQTPLGIGSKDVAAVSVADPQDADSPISNWLQRQEKIDALLPHALPCVVAVEGGSGVIVNEDGLILTVAHVAGIPGRRIEVRLSDGRTIPAKTLGTNLSADTAAVQLLAPGPWPHLSIGDSKPLQSGQWCLSFGFPSSFPRDRPAAVRIGRILRIEGDQIVTDCPIMGGDSGGPLLNLNGQVIGINSRVKNVIAQNNHIPVGTYLAQWNEMTSATNVVRPPDNGQWRPSLGLRAETDEGRVRVRSVQKGAPAELAGLMEEDVILVFGDSRVRDFEQILQIVKDRRPGDQIGMVINRSGKLMRLTVTLQESLKQ